MKKVKVFVFYFCFYFSTKCAFAQDANLLFPQGTSYQIGLTAKKTELDIPVNLNPKTKIAPEIRTVKIQFQDPLSDIADSIIQSRVIRDTFNNTYIHLSINNSSPLRQGRYNLILQETKPSDSNGKFQNYNIDITVKPSTIQQPLNVIASIVGCDVSMKPLALIETSYNTSLNPITIEEINLKDLKGMPINSNISFITDGKVVKAGGKTDILYTLNSDDLPLGKTTGDYRIISPQLSTPVTFTLEINKKKSPWWIVWITFVGLVVGYFSRTYLDNRKSIEELHSIVEELQMLIKKENGKRKSAAFQAALKKLETDLESVNFKNKTAVDASIKNTQASLETAIKEFDAQSKVLQDNLNKLQDTLSKKTWALPPSILNTITDANNSITSTLIGLMSNDYTKADLDFKALKIDLLEGIRINTINYKSNLENGLRAIFDSRFKIIDNNQQTLLQKLNEIITATKTIPLSNISDSPETLDTLFQAIHDLTLKILDWINNLVEYIRTILDGVKNILFIKQINVEADFDEKREYISNKLKIEDYSIEPKLSIIESELNSFQDWMRIKLITDHQNVPVDKQAEISKAVQEGKFTEAANLLVDNIPATNLDNPRIESLPQKRFGAFYNDFYYRSNLIPQMPPVTTRILQTNYKTDNIEQIHSSTLSKILWINIGQTILVGIGILVIGYLLFVDKFTGSVNDMFEVFSWSVVLDVTVNTTLSAQAARVPPKLHS